MLAGQSTLAQDSADLDAAVRQRAVAVLHDAVNNEEQWVKVHAAEFLLALDYRDGIRETFEQELAEYGDQTQYRIGIWRVLARQAQSAKQRNHFISRIRAAFLDVEGPDRLHALETLAKLNYQAGSVVLDPLSSSAEETTPQQRELLQAAELEAFAAADTDSPELRPFARWVQLNSAVDAKTRRLAEQQLAQLLSETDELKRLLAAYALGMQPTIDSDTWTLLQDAVESEPVESAARVYLVTAAFLQAPKTDAGVEQREILKREILQFAAEGNKDQRYQACAALAEKGGEGCLPLLLSLIDDQQLPSDVRVAASNAVCRIGRRRGHALAMIDWVIIVAYGLGMVGVGWYYSRRTESTEDYMLGGRNMRSWAVGLSLFATLLSTISYLAQPGEMITNGPMILCQVLAYPLIALTVCYFVIPYIMRLKVTSAYELLETRFGISVRLLGATIFLVLRLLWMAVIIYATTDKVLVPLLGLDSAVWTPGLCAILGVITLIYTSLGGMRAVVFTDVVQTAILLCGALLALGTITVSMGGVGAWWPTEWSDRWAPPSFGFETNARVTLGWAMVSAFIWYVCTSASDQMAIQRYLATRDVAAARRAFVTMMAIDALVIVLLATLGLALFAYFQTNPYHIPDGQTLQANADQLFPQFIIFGLPVGVTGLVVAGLLAAAMSSLSSGMNSSCAVITTDFIDRFKRDPMQETNHVRLAKYVSLAVGAAVVGLSLIVNVVPGNLLEVAFRVVNLFVVPLFILFFMAMFVPWGTTFGTWSASISSALTAVVIAYWPLVTAIGPVQSLLTRLGVPPSTTGPSFLFILPTSLLVGVIVGPLFSLIPVGPPARQGLSEITS